MPAFTIKTEEKVHGEYLIDAADEQAARDLFEQGRVQPPRIFESVEVLALAVEPADSLSQRPKFRNHALVRVKGDRTVYEIMSHAGHETDGWIYALTRAGTIPTLGKHPDNPITEDQLEEVA